MIDEGLSRKKTGFRMAPVPDEDDASDLVVGQVVTVVIK